MFDAVPLGDGADASGSELFDDARLAALNEKYLPLDFEQRIRSLYQDFAPEKVLVTSSFAATSAYFLHIISRIRPQQLIHFIDTGFHFPETLDYRRYLIDLFKLKVEDVRAEDWQHQFTVDDRTYQRDPDYCCSINKIQPLEGVKSGAEVWVSSLMRWQTDHRAGLPVFESPRYSQVQPHDRRHPGRTRSLHHRAQAAVPSAGGTGLFLDRLHALHGRRRWPQRPLGRQAQDRVRPAPVTRAETAGR